MPTFMSKGSESFSVEDMTKVPTIEEWIERYVASTGLAMWKFMRHWMSQGYSYQDAIKKAVPLGLGMLRESVGDRISVDQAESALRDIAAAYLALADVLNQMREGRAEVQSEG
jgi:hypothetical protein